MESAELVVIVLAIGVGALIKGMTGSGLPQIAIPVMAIFLGVERSVVVMAVPGVVSNGWLLWRYRRHLNETRDLPVLLGAGIGGAVAGSWLVSTLDPRILSAVLATMILAYVVVRTTSPGFHLPAHASRWVSPPVGLAAGVLQGGTGISGPLVTTYLHSFRLPPPVFVASLVTVFLVFGLAQLVTFIGIGLLTPQRLLESLLALVPMGAALVLGARLADRITRRTFDRWVLALLLGSAAVLVRNAVVG